MADDKKAAAEDADPGALREWVARARAISALLAFGLAYIVATRAGVPTADAIIRGIIAAAIFSTFLIPYFPKIMLAAVIKIPCMVLIAAGLLCGVFRLLRRAMQLLHGDAGVIGQVTLPEAMRPHHV